MNVAPEIMMATCWVYKKMYKMTVDTSFLDVSNISLIATQGIVTVI